jgi:hypothetical protein
MRIEILFIELITILITSCGTTKMLTSNIDPKKIDTLIFFKPISAIAYISKRNIAIYDSKLSKIAEDHVVDGIKEYFSDNINIRTVRFDTVMQNRIDTVIISLINIVEKRGKINKIFVPETIDSIMIQMNVNYALCMFHSGFTRTSQNYSGQAEKVVALGLFTFVMLNNTVPFKATSNLWCCILDKKNNNIAFYRKNFRQNEPVDKRITDKQISKIFNKYFERE